ncbi:MAG: protoheme IX farnesyltransferase [Planctomycetes bacterium]|nr:protoheme IX farnesyltransferase [Planctomycetota bacterium]
MAAAPLDREGLAALLRPRIALLVLVTCAAGYALERPADWSALPWALLGTLLVSAAGTALNHWLERDTDARMERTKNRPLVTGALTSAQVVGFGLTALVAGLAVAIAGAGWMAALLLACASLTYLAIYTPLKRRTSTNTWVGAIPGALPLVVGAAAAAPLAGPGLLAWTAFGLIFLWQLPHFFAIASMYRDEYSRGGLRMLSGDDPEDRMLRWTMPMQVMSVVLVSALPVLAGQARALYGFVALVLGLLFLVSALGFFRQPDRRGARRVVVASVLYLPLVLASLVVDVACRPAAAAVADVDEGVACEHCADGATTSGALHADTDAACAACATPSRRAAPLADAVHHVLPQPADGSGLPSYGELPEFALTADDGRPFTRGDMLGDVWLVDFIYTRCAGQCVDMAKSYAALAGEGLPARLLSITVDAAHDDAATLAAYRARQGGALADDDAWRLLTGDPEAIAALARDGFRLPVGGEAPEVEGLPQLFHSGRFALVDGEGRVRGTYEPADALQLAELRDDVRALAAARDASGAHPETATHEEDGR